MVSESLAGPVTNGSGGVAESVFVQPHFDDVALSCGGTVAEQARQGQAKIVTVFAGVPGEDLGDFARFQHERWELSDAEVVSARRREDLAAAHELGSSIEVAWLDYLDAIYRREGYSSDAALFGAVEPEDFQLVDEIAKQLEAQGDRFFVPLAIGNHVDHQIVFMVGRRLAELGRGVCCYADLPYALDEPSYRRRLSQLGDPRPCSQAISAELFDRRWRAIERYESQLHVLFRDIANPREQLERFGRRHNDEAPVELFWSMDEIEGRLK